MILFVDPGADLVCVSDFSMCFRFRSLSGIESKIYFLSYSTDESDMIVGYFGEDHLYKFYFIMMKYHSELKVPETHYFHIFIFIIFNLS